MRGLPEYGFPLFDQARDFLLDRGYQVVSPADMDRDVGFDPKADEDVTLEFVHGAMRRDIEEILTCDGIVMLPNWEESGGANCERDVAKRIGLHVFHIDLDTGALQMEDANV